MQKKIFNLVFLFHEDQKKMRREVSILCKENALILISNGSIEYFVVVFKLFFTSSCSCSCHCHCSACSVAQVDIIASSCNVI